MMTERIRSHFVKVGLVLIIAAVVGGGVSMVGLTVPVVTSAVVRAVLFVLGVVLIAAALIQPRRFHTFIVTSPRSSISVPQGTIWNPSYKTTRFGGHESRIVAAEYRRGEDDKHVAFTDRLGRVIRGLRGNSVAIVRRS
jgi:hypothetical protein